MAFPDEQAVQEAAVELREIQWDKFVDAADIRSAVEIGSLLVQDVRKAWNLANPISRYHPAAERKIQDASRDPSSANSEKER